MKDLLKRILRQLVFKAPWGAREAVLNACIERLSPVEVYSRLLPSLKFVEVAADGDRGIMTSAAHDTMVIIEYALTGTFSATITR